MKVNCDKLVKIQEDAGQRGVNQRIIGENLSKVFRAYAFMDVLRYSEAYDTLVAVGKNTDFVNLLSEQYKELLERQIGVLNTLQGGGTEETADNLVDLYFNMKRCNEDRNAFADVLARFRRIEEGCVYFRLSQNWGIKPRNLQNSEAVRLEQMQKVFPSSYKGKFINLEPGRKALLKVFEDPDYKKMWDAYPMTYVSSSGRSVNKIQSLSERRNESLIAHGMGSVSGEDAKDCCDIAEQMIQALIPGAQELMEHYPFKKEDFQKWMTLL